MDIIIRDRYGYWEEVTADSPDEAVRISSNLSPDARLEYATTSFVGFSRDIPQSDIEEHNCSVAMEHGTHCQCGNH